jgi:nuclear protein localization protein 4 homolog
MHALLSLCHMERCLIRVWYACAGKLELRQHLTKMKAKPYVERLSDFHLLLWLSKQPNLDLTSDMALLAQAVQQRTQVPEGYTLIIDSLADL